MTRKMAVLASGVVLAACASTGVVSTGDNEYMISKTDVGDTWHEGSKVLVKLYKEGNSYCAKKGLSLERISEETKDGQTFVRAASATLRFRCVARQK
jgi:hypothetical protein